jgi:aspartate ammonia-lyase
VRRREGRPGKEGTVGATRKEKDSLGEVQVPAEAYWGVQTQRALDNFPVSGRPTHRAVTEAFLQQKKASARAHLALGTIPPEVGGAIVEAADECLAGRHAGQFVVDQFQAGAGTSFNMNCNEVLANRALEILGAARGDYKRVSPNDHVNMAQSTNDTFPTALHVSTLTMHWGLDRALGTLAEAFAAKGREFARIPKSGRTHLQDAVPVTLGQEFTGYGLTVARARRLLADAARELEPVALGGSAVGTGMNCPPGYRVLAIRLLAEQTGLRLRPADDLREKFQSHLPVAHYSGALRNLALELTRIANDLRLLCSGPQTGFGEIVLPAVQPGSSIMPGKVNPVMAECLNMICFKVLGNDHCVAMAVQAGQLELNVMMPVMAQALTESHEILANFLPHFAERCVKGIVADAAACARYYEESPSLATVLNPVIGYLRAAEVAKECVKTGTPIRRLIVEKGLVSKEEADRLLDPVALTEGPDAAPAKAAAGAKAPPAAAARGKGGAAGAARAAKPAKGAAKGR